MIVDFFEGIDKARLQFKKDEESIKQKRELESFLAYIWNRYDADNSGGIDTEETKQMIEDITSRTVSVRECKQFLRHIDGDGDNIIQSEELLKFIYAGLSLDEEQKQQYSSRGELHETIIEFFAGMDRKRIEFAAQRGQAATKIQATYRGLQGRQGVQNTKIEQQKRNKESRSATKIQSIARGRAERLRQKERVQQKKEHRDAGHRA